MRIVVAPVSAGKIQKDDVLIDNFNNLSNLQGLGTTIVDYNPATKQTTLFAKLPRHLPQCPGGVGLTTAMTMLKSGWVIVGSTPSNDGTTRTKGDGCLLVLDANGQLVDTWAGPDINGPWGNMAVDRQRHHGDAVRQHGRLRRAGPAGARSRDRLSRDGAQSHRAADRSVDPGRQAAGDHQPDRRRERLRPARRQGSSS